VQGNAGTRVINSSFLCGLRSEHLAERGDTNRPAKRLRFLATLGLS
jgi:hypothetical protein